jgi:hypothetical protein
MSASGQTRRLGHVGDMSGLPQTADISGSGRHFAFVPILLQKSAIPMVRLRRRFSGTVFLSRRV